MSEMFKVGDKVFLNTTSKFVDLDNPKNSDPLYIFGIVSRASTGNGGDQSITVKWSNGTENFYNKACLRFARVRNSTLARKLYPEYKENGKWLEVE